MPITSITSSNGFQSAIRSGNLVVIDFVATWCGPCRMLAPKLEAMVTKYPTVRFCKVDVDALDDVASSQGVTAMPTVVLYKNGREVARIVGVDVAKIEAAIAKHK